MSHTGTMQRQQAGFTLIEVMITVVIVGILASIAYPSYTQYVTRTYRDSAKACLLEHAQYMERRYSAHFSYEPKKDPQTDIKPDITDVKLDCATASNMSDRYDIKVPKETIEQSKFTAEAKPLGAQADNEKQCGTMTINQKGQRTAMVGETKSDQCW